MSECVAQPQGQGRHRTQQQNGGEAHTDQPTGPTSFLQEQANRPRPVSEATVAKAGLITGRTPSCLPSESTGKRKAQPRLQQALTKHWEKDLMS